MLVERAIFVEGGKMSTLKSPDEKGITTTDNYHFACAGTSKNPTSRALSHIDGENETRGLSRVSAERPSEIGCLYQR